LTWIGIIYLGMTLFSLQSLSAKTSIDLDRSPISKHTAQTEPEDIPAAKQPDRKEYYQGSLADFDRSIQLHPNDAIAYKNRGDLKVEKLQDIQGGLADYNRAIQLDPNYAIAYHNRGSLKAAKFQDIQGGLADYNRAIQLKPNDARAYSQRGRIKYNGLNDRSGAIIDMQQAVKLYQQQGDLANYQMTLELLKKWQTTNP
jgi:tetratricopeptide (TPR) repeat protein